VKLVVISPHLDDAVMSVGATMHRAARRGADVVLVTVFAGDVSSDGLASYWDARRGVAEKSAVLGARRREDAAAAEVLGARSVWLPFDDGAYVSLRDPDVIWAALAPLLDDADAVLLPGWPLSHPDHRFTSLLVVERAPAHLPLLFFAEMPYGAHPVAMAKGFLKGRRSALLAHAYGGVLEWRRSPVTKDDFAAKQAAVHCYAGELETLGLDATFAAVHDRVLRRELLACDLHQVLPEAIFGGPR